MASFDRVSGRSLRAAGLRLIAVLLPAFALAPPAWSLPSFAQQTGVGCAQCHTAAFGPALTQYGREFKLNGYTLGGNASIPLAAMAVGTWTQTGADVPGGAAPHFDPNDNFAVSEVSGFFGGKIADHFGGFAQVTYSGVDRATAWDNLDMRFVEATKIGATNVILGLSLNNNPTIQDQWNSTPGWGYPYTSSDLAPTPAAAPLVDGGLAQQVLGLTAYAELNDTWYFEFGGYENLSNSLLANLGVDQPSELDHVHGFTPYWRLAWQKELGANYLQAGIFGLSPKLYPGNDSSQGTNSYNDYGYDATWQFVNGGPHLFTAQATYIREDQRLNASNRLGDANGAGHNLDELKLNLHYNYKQTYSASAGYFDTTGTRDTSLYAPDPVDGSANGRPDSRGYLFQADWVPWGKLTSAGQPWMNLRLGVQYTLYDKFNGGNHNYDGFGRSASDNNTLYLFAWLAI